MVAPLPFLFCLGLLSYQAPMDRVNLIYSMLCYFAWG
ncbi:hypothetical protein CY0110_16112 [Crocosphaera chwakensis CCY0110]|uniref:Uncharacterized protein n=1 Tax=Crocosphaera chwakensis CCY0110 TaxID=391612 RepID=A3IHQ4_9CHRO|nr:hypothetical protein CY0110_16112 [Crocosphaera chwakensis CCY0110]